MRLQPAAVVAAALAPVAATRSSPWRVPSLILGRPGSHVRLLGLPVHVLHVAGTVTLLLGLPVRVHVVGVSAIMVAVSVAIATLPLLPL